MRPLDVIPVSKHPSFTKIKNGRYIFKGFPNLHFTDTCKVSADDGFNIYPLTGLNKKAIAGTISNSVLDNVDFNVSDRPRACIYIDGCVLSGVSFFDFLELQFCDSFIAASVFSEGRHHQVSRSAIISSTFSERSNIYSSFIFLVRNATGVSETVVNTSGLYGTVAQAAYGGWDIWQVSKRYMSVGCQTHPVASWLKTGRSVVPWDKYVTAEQRIIIQAMIKAVADANKDLFKDFPRGVTAVDVVGCFKDFVLGVGITAEQAKIITKLGKPVERYFYAK